MSAKIKFQWVPLEDGVHVVETGDDFNYHIQINSAYERIFTWYGDRRSDTSVFYTHGYRLCREVAVQDEDGNYEHEQPVQPTQTDPWAVIEEQGAEIAKLSEELDTTGKGVVIAASAILDLGRDRDYWKGRWEGMHQTALEMEKEADRTRTTLFTQEKEITNLKNMVAHLEQDKVEMAKHLGQARTANTALVGTVNRLEREREELKEANQSLVECQKTQGKHISALVDDNGALREKLGLANGRIFKLVKNWEEEVQRNEELKGEVFGLKVKIENMSLREHDWRFTVKYWREKHTETVKELNELRSENYANAMEIELRDRKEKGYGET